MNFLNPIVLFGLVAASIPLILHLLNLRKIKIIEFSSLKFVKEMQKTRIRKLKLKQILLLVLRTLIIIFVVLAFARPTISTNLPLIGTYSKSDIVILIDNSFSMDMPDEFGNRWTQTKHMANNIINNMIDGDEAAIVPLTVAGVNASFMSNSPTILKQELSKLTISNKTANLNDAVRYAINLLGKGMNINKEIYIITDAQPNIYSRRDEEAKELFLSNTNVFLIPIGYKSLSGTNNVSIDSVNFITRIFREGKPVEIKVNLHNHSSIDIYGLVTSMYLNNIRVAQSSADIPAGKSKDILLSTEVNMKGLVKGQIRIENDAFDYDNIRYFSFSIPEKPKIAVFGDESSVLPISIVLNNESVSSIFESYSSTQIASIDFSKFDIVILADGPYKSQDFDKARNYVSNGGSLLVFADRTPTQNIFSSGLASLGFINIKYIDVAQKNLKFDYTDKSHPIFEGVFKGSTDYKKIVESPEIQKLLAPSSGLKIIGTPAGQFLSESQIDKGKIIYISINTSSDWSNFTKTGIFPVLIYRCIVYLTSRESVGQDFLIGENSRYKLTNNNINESSYKLIDPQNREAFIEAISIPSGSIIDIGNQPEPGTYSIYSRINNNLAGYFSLNRDASESDIIKTNDKMIADSLKSIINNKIHVNILEPNNLAKGIQRARVGSELWQFFIIMALITALAEMFVARSAKNEQQ